MKQLSISSLRSTNQQTKPGFRDNGKEFRFEQRNPELPDGDYAIELLVTSKMEEFKDYVAKFPQVINFKDKSFGSVPLHVAASRGDLALMNFLLTNGASLNTQDMFGNTPLHYACDKSRRNAVEILLNSGSNPNATDFKGASPLHLACKNNDVEIVKILLKFNSDPEIMDIQEIKPRDKTTSPMIRSLLDQRIKALNGGDELQAKQTMQWMSFGVGLGVGLGMAMAKQQQFMIEQTINAKLSDNKPARKRGHISYSETPSSPQVQEVSNQELVVANTSSLLTSSQNISIAPPNRKFL